MKKENEEKLFTKKDYWNIFMYMLIMSGSIFSGMTVYLFFTYGYISLFSDYSFFSIVNIGSILLMFFVIIKMFQFWKWLWNEWQDVLYWSFYKSTPFVSASKRKIKEPEKPENDWLKSSKNR